MYLKNGKNASTLGSIGSNHVVGYEWYRRKMAFVLHELIAEQIALFYGLDLQISSSSSMINA